MSVDGQPNLRFLYASFIILFLFFRCTAGSYIYFETSSPAVSRDNAKLLLTVPGGAACLVFYYHMFGSGMGTLNVFDGSTNVFTKTGNKGNAWHKAEVTVSSNKVSAFLLTYNCWTNCHWSE